MRPTAAPTEESVTGSTEVSYLAVIGDLIGSRRLDSQPRRRLQAELGNTFDVFGSERPGVASRPLMTLGDEFQALLAADAAGIVALRDFLIDVQETCRPTLVRFGVGVGPLTTAIRLESIGMDGPCFHHARRAIEQAKDQNIPCRVASDQKRPDELASLLVSAALHQRQTWTDAQRQAIDLYKNLGSWTEVSSRLGISRGAVSQRQRAAGWNLYRQLESGLTLALETVLEGTRERGQEKPGPSSEPPERERKVP